MSATVRGGRGAKVEPDVAAGSAIGSADASPVASGHCIAAKPMRADAQRNYDLLLSTAAEAFQDQGVDASLEDIARRAGVGIGTLYRHFPTRSALIEAVYRREVESLCVRADELLASVSPEEALQSWMAGFVQHVARKRGMASALKAANDAAHAEAARLAATGGPAANGGAAIDRGRAATGGPVVEGTDGGGHTTTDGAAPSAPSALFSYVHDLIFGAADRLLAAAVADGAIRADVNSRDLMRAIGGICLANDQPDWQDQAGRLVNLLMDGLRYRAPAR